MAESNTVGHALCAVRKVTQPADYKRVFADGKSTAGRYVVLWALDGLCTGTRAGVVASQRTFPRAHQRNRAKRLLRESFRLNFGRLRQGLKLVMIGRRRILDVKRQDVEKDFLKVCRRAGVLGDA